MSAHCALKEALRAREAALEQLAGLELSSPGRAIVQERLHALQDAIDRLDLAMGRELELPTDLSLRTRAEDVARADQVRALIVAQIRVEPDAPRLSPLERAALWRELNDLEERIGG